MEETEHAELKLAPVGDWQKYRDSFIRASIDIAVIDEGWTRSIVDNTSVLNSNFKAYVRKIARLHDAKAARAKGIVPFSLFWLVKGDAWLGRISIRHHLNEGLLTTGGHIGYLIAPKERRQGYGTQILKLALPIAASLGIERALLTCDDTNLGSQRIIEKNGGVLWDKITRDNGRLTRRYWIDLTL